MRFWFRAAMYGPSVNAIAESDTEKKLAGEFQSYYRDYLEICERQFLPLLGQGESAAELGRVAALLEERRERAARALDGLAGILVQKMHDAKEEYAGLISRTASINGIVYVFNLLVAFLLAYLLRRLIQKPVTRE